MSTEIPWRDLVTCGMWTLFGLWFVVSLLRRAARDYKAQSAAAESAPANPEAPNEP